MKLTLDKHLGERILREEAKLADSEDAPEKWLERIEALSQVCEKHDVRTHIAHLGIAILAKATDRRVDPFAIKARSKRPGAYSARSFGDALVRNARELGIDLGTRGREPLQNQPYEKSDEVSGDMVVKPATRPALDAHMEALAALSRVGTESDAREVLRAYIQVRRRYTPAYPEADHGPMGLSTAEFVLRLEDFVAAKSEGGRRAQAVAAGLVAAAYGPQQVVCQRINDPDRKLPGDVGLRSRDESGWEIVLEVRDKQVTPSDIQIFAEKALDAGARKAAVVAVAGGQSPLEALEQTAFAAKHGLLLTLLPGWRPLVETMLLWSQRPTGELVAGMHTEIHNQLVLIEASPAAVLQWKTLRSG